MGECTICNLVKGKDGVIFENESIAILLAPSPAVSGHLLVVPKNHAPIMEQVPDETIGELWQAANKAVLGVFHAFQAGGTNLLIRNGPGAGQAFGHFSIEIIPRSSGDGLKLQWQPRQMGEEEMSALELRLKEELSKASEKQEPRIEEEKKPKELAKEEDYLLRQLERLP